MKRSKWSEPRSFCTVSTSTLSPGARWSNRNQVRTEAWPRPGASTVRSQRTKPGADADEIRRPAAPWRAACVTVVALAEEATPARPASASKTTEVGGSRGTGAWAPAGTSVVSTAPMPTAAATARAPAHRRRPFALAISMTEAE